MFSPNGKWIAYEFDESGEYEIYVRRFPEAGDSLAESPPTHLVLVQNFDEELKRLVPIER